MSALRYSLLIASLLVILPVEAQNASPYQSDFVVETLKERRTRVLNSIGNDAIALIQGAAGRSGFSVFRQTNSFYSLTGVETDHAYLLLNGRNQQTTLYLPHRNESREAGEGKVLSAEDAELVISLTGVDAVKGYEYLAADLLRTGLI